MMRILLLVLTNLAVVLVLSVSASLLGVTHYMTANGLQLGSLLAFCALMGFGGAFISLLISRPMARWMTGARVVTGAEGGTEAWLVASVRALAERAGLPMPQVAIYDGEPNAFATGASRRGALVAVSTGLLSGMTHRQIEAVIAHELTHISNGDMVTATLLQGVLNTLIMAVARVVGYVVDKSILKNENSAGIGYYATVFVLELFLGIGAALVVAAFSRHREYKADMGAATLLGGPQAMISALQALDQMKTEATLPKAVQAFGISGKTSWFSLFASHPALEARVAALYAWKAEK